jgi:hypothetical protein
MEVYRRTRSVAGDFARPFQELDLRDRRRLQPSAVFIFAAVRPAPHRPLFASGRALGFFDDLCRRAGPSPR